MDVQIPCLCPPDQSRHPDGDRVTLRDRLGFFEASSIRNSVLVLKQEDPQANTADILAVMTEANVLAGVSAWTLVNDKGEPIEVSRATIREFVLPNLDVAMTIGEAADEMYREVMLPLVVRAFKSSPSSPTNEPMSPTSGSPQKPRKPSKPSSISTIPTAATETTSRSLDGVSNSSQSSESAA